MATGATADTLETPAAFSIAEFVELVLCARAATPLAANKAMITLATPIDRRSGTANATDWLNIWLLPISIIFYFDSPEAIKIYKLILVAVGLRRGALMVIKESR